MSKVQVFNIGDEILVAQGNTTADFYTKSKVKWSVSEQVLVLNDITGEEPVQLFSSPADNFSPNQSDISVIELLINLNNMLLVGGSKPEKKVAGDYTLTNDDANYLILWDLSGGNATMKLPPDALPGLTWEIKDIGNAAVGTNEGTVSGNGRNIEGSASAPVIDTAYEDRTVYLSAEQGEYLIM